MIQHLPPRLPLLCVAYGRFVLSFFFVRLGTWLGLFTRTIGCKASSSKMKMSHNRHNSLHPICNSLLRKVFLFSLTFTALPSLLCLLLCFLRSQALSPRVSPVGRALGLCPPEFTCGCDFTSILFLCVLIDHLALFYTLSLFIWGVRLRATFDLASPGTEPSERLFASPLPLRSVGPGFSVLPSPLSGYRDHFFATMWQILAPLSQRIEAGVFPRGGEESPPSPATGFVLLFHSLLPVVHLGVFRHSLAPFPALLASFCVV